MNFNPQPGDTVTIRTWIVKRFDGQSCSFYDSPFYFPNCALVGYSSSSQSIPISSISFDSLIQPLTTP